MQVDDNGKPIKKPRVWRKKSQKTMVDKAKTKKVLAALERSRAKGVVV